MSEPQQIAPAIEPITEGVWRWHVWDDRIDFESDAFAVESESGFVLIDPLPLQPAALARFEPVAAICLTAACHQRSAWRYRRMFGVRVFAPNGCRAMEEEPDARYQQDDDLPGGLVAVHTPGPETAHYAFWRAARRAVLPGSGDAFGQGAAHLRAGRVSRGSPRHT